ncbi:MAG: thiamine biosynthesis protein ApbE [Rhodospirillaceae bacterium]|nr:thiamine biosynthesis protein ApbE [Rhodospirillaceae bacterium]|tara:strand:- start:303 stop:1358 length:1056 start_codon:yes stop_codon:yes gene_type:complete
MNNPQGHTSLAPAETRQAYRTISRRRAITLFGCAAGLPTLGLGTAFAGSKDISLYKWEGSALGAQAQLTLAHHNPEEAKNIISSVIQEIERLEQIFSLHRPESELTLLNSQGYISNPSADLTKLCKTSIGFGYDTDGAFDITVQPLWKVFTKHFQENSAASEGPPSQEILKALNYVDYRAVDVSSQKINFGRPGMEVTLNGIAQGYITDTVTELLQQSGITQVLVELGETRTLGEHPEGRPWRIGLADPKDRTKTTETVELENKAVATSSGFGTKFNRDGSFHHLFDPRTGLPRNHNISVSVVSDSAAVADAMSTALFIATPDNARPIVERVGGMTAVISATDGTKRRIVS